VTRAIDVGVDQLPVLPAVVVRLMGLSPASDSYFEEVLRVAGEDPGLAIRVIHAANSTESAPIHPVHALQSAVARLGATRIGSLVTAMAVTQVFVPRSRREVDLWVHAIEVASACELMAASDGSLGIEPHHAYVCGLLHDIGRFVMFDLTPDKLRAVDDGGWASPAELVSAEEEIFGYTHSEVGYQLCLRWNIPPRIAAVVRDHHKPLELRPPVGGDERLVAMVEMADQLSVLLRTHGIGALDTDADTRTALMAATCVDPAWPAPPVPARVLAALAPRIVEAARAASGRLALTYT